MFSPRQLKRLLAAWLPLCLVWAFVSCVGLCSTHDAGEARAATASNRAEDAHESECCPLAEASRGVMPERVSPASGPDGGAAPASAVSAPPASSVLFPPTIFLNSSSPDPPFERLRTLRI